MLARSLLLVSCSPLLFYPSRSFRFALERVSQLLLSAVVVVVVDVVVIGNVGAVDVLLLMLLFVLLSLLSFMSFLLLSFLHSSSQLSSSIDVAVVAVASHRLCAHAAGALHTRFIHQC